MYLTIIYLFLISIFTLFPIFISRRRNFKILLCFIMSFLVMVIISSVDGINNLLHILSKDIYNGLKDLLSIRIDDSSESYLFIYVNVYFVIFVIFMICFYLINSIYIRNKSNFREFENEGMKRILKVSMSVLNVLFFSFVALVFLSNLNIYWEVKTGFLDNIFNLGNKVRYYL